MITLRGLGEFTVNGAPASTARVGDTIVFNIPGQTRVYIEQYQNGILQYKGPLNLPMSYQLLDRDAGSYSGRAFQIDVNGNPIPYPIESWSFLVNPRIIPSGPAPIQGGVTAGTIAPSGAPSGYIPAPGTPVNGGGVPTGITVGATPQCLDAVYRFIYHDASNTATPWISGANQAGCSKSNTLNCDAKNFSSLQAAIDYAHAHGEIPYQVYSPNEAWDLISCKIAINPHQILDHGMNWVMIAGIALAAWFLSGR